MAEPVTYERRGAAAVVTIDRQERRNAVDGPTAELLGEAYERFEADDDARVMVLTGAGGVAFCAGADLKAIDTFGAAARARTRARSGSRAGSRSKPTIAAICGWCLAGGIELALWCDLRIATEGSTLGFTERRFGVPLIDGGTQRLPRIVGLGRALDIILTGGSCEADEALAIGLLTEIVPRRRSTSTARSRWPRRWPRFPQETMLADRRAAIEGIGMTFEEGLRSRPSAAPATFETAWRGAARFAGGEGRGGAGAGVLAQALRGRDAPSRRIEVARPAQVLRRPSRPCAGSRSRSSRGEVFGLLGPNGAGKTTTVEILEGYRDRIGGRGVACSGYDPARRDRRLKQRVGIVLQSVRLLPARDGARVGRALRQAYPHPRDVRETIALVGLEDKEDAARQPSSPAASGAGSTSRSRSSATPSWSSSTSPPPASTRPPAATAWEVIRPLRGARQDAPADHPLPRRGAGARRPRRDRQGRPDRGRGAAGRARPAARPATGSPTSRGPPGRASRPTTRPSCSTA